MMSIFLRINQFHYEMNFFFLSKWSDEENKVTNTTKIESLNATEEAKSDRIGKSNS